MTQEELKKIIENHQHWLNEDCDGWNNMRANLSDEHLDGLNLDGASLDGASLDGASLVRASLDGASLVRASLNGASLDGASLVGASLYGASLDGASLDGASLVGASLYRASLDGASLDGASLDGVKINECTSFYDLQCPEEGDFIAFKKASGLIVKLRIPAEARRSSATSRKCRAEFADVLEILNTDKTKADVTEVASNYNCEVIYEVGERVTADSWDDNRWNECSHGIHFFMTFAEAVRY